MTRRIAVSNLGNNLDDYINVKLYSKDRDTGKEYAGNNHIFGYHGYQYNKEGATLEPGENITFEVSSDFSRIETKITEAPDNVPRYKNFKADNIYLRDFKDSYIDDDYYDDRAIIFPRAKVIYVDKHGLEYEKIDNAHNNESEFVPINSQRVYSQKVSLVKETTVFLLEREIKKLNKELKKMIHSI